MDQNRKSPLNNSNLEYDFTDSLGGLSLRKRDTSSENERKKSESQKSQNSIDEICSNKKNISDPNSNDKKNINNLYPQSFILDKTSITDFDENKITERNVFLSGNSLHQNTTNYLQSTVSYQNYLQEYKSESKKAFSHNNLINYGIIQQQDYNNNQNMNPYQQDFDFVPKPNINSIPFYPQKFEHERNKFNTVSHKNTENFNNQIFNNNYALQMQNQNFNNYKDPNQMRLNLPKCNVKFIIFS
jgi:hypothetical protein